MSTHQNVIITGASSGIGRAIATRLADDGARIALLGRNRERLAEVAHDTDAVAHESADVTSREELHPALDRLRDALGGIDAVITSAGGTGGVDTETEPKEAETTWHAIVDQNLTGTFYTVLALAKHLSRPGGRIITLSSIAGVSGPTGSLAYAAAKADEVAEARRPRRLAHGPG